MHDARRWTVAVLFLLLASWAISDAQTADTHLVALRAAKLLDVKSQKTVSNPVVIIDGEKIKQAGPGLEIPAGARVIDLGNATLLP